ncbi:protein FAM228A-like [Sorex fumeus]|uniref:protein FAM228A-like n=1 Tax=Sorex fumeus TaxID=62283 RepID=UPI0024AD3C96|nr:protein FAM228A-like [Sorex fumeus]
MAVDKSPDILEHFKVEKLKEWPQLDAVALMEELAREDIDEAVHAILFRENYVVKRLDTYLKDIDALKERKKELLHKKWTENVATPLQESIIKKVLSYRGLRKKKEENFEYFLSHTRKKVTVPAFSDPLFKSQRKKEEERRAHLQYKTGRPYSSKEFKELEKAKQYSRLPQFPFPFHDAAPKDQSKAYLKAERSKLQRNYSPKDFCAESKEQPDKEKKGSWGSQTAFERSFQASRMGRRAPDGRGTKIKVGKISSTSLAFTVFEVIPLGSPELGGENGDMGAAEATRLLGLRPGRGWTPGPRLLSGCSPRRPQGVDWLQFPPPRAPHGGAPFPHNTLASPDVETAAARPACER